MFPRINLSELRPGRFEIASRPNFYPTVRQCIQQNIQKKKRPTSKKKGRRRGKIITLSQKRPNNVKRDLNLENNCHFTKES
jgi:hypothetical protein